MQSDDKITKFQKALRLLFRSSDLVCVGNLYATEIGPQPPKPVAEFFCINPLAPLEHRKLNGEALMTFKAGSRADLNVSRFQNFLFEMDNTPLVSQIQYIRDSGFPFATVTYSGGKSYHGIISLEVPLLAKPHTQEGIDEYKRIWKQLATVFTSRLNQPLTLLDPACQNPSRLSRLPEAVRDNGNVQELIQLGSLCSTEELNSILSEAPDSKIPKKAFQQELSDINEEQLKLILSTYLLKQLKYPKLWASGTSSGNYQNLLRLSLWLIDESGAAESVIVSFLEKYTFPYLVETGYPIEKCYKPIKDAFRIKRRT